MTVISPVRQPEKAAASSKNEGFSITVAQLFGEIAYKNKPNWIIDQLRNGAEVASNLVEQGYGSQNSAYFLGSGPTKFVENGFIKRDLNLTETEFARLQSDMAGGRNGSNRWRHNGGYGGQQNSYNNNYGYGNGYGFLANNLSSLKITDKLNFAQQYELAIYLRGKVTAATPNGGFDLGICKLENQLQEKISHRGDWSPPEDLEDSIKNIETNIAFLKDVKIALEGLDAVIKEFRDNHPEVFTLPPANSPAIKPRQRRKSH